MTPEDVLAIFPGARILTAEEAQDFISEQADLDAIENERACWRSEAGHSQGLANAVPFVRRTAKESKDPEAKLALAQDEL
jgi:hypothetical protein